MKKRTLVCLCALLGLLSPSLLAQLMVTAIPTPPSCAGKADGCWMLTLQQGEAPAAFTWRNLTADLQGMGMLTATGTPLHLKQLRAGNYRFDFMGNDGAVGHLELTLPEPPPLEGRIFTFGPSDPCTYPGWAVGFFQVGGGTPPYAYQWSNGATTPRIDSITSGRWQATATDANGCRIEVDTLLQLPKSLQADVQVFGESCAGRSDGRLRLQAVSGGLEPYLFSLNNRPFSPKSAWDSLPPGLHLLHIEDAIGCSLSIAALVPAGLPFLFGVGADTAILQGDTLYRTVVSSLSLQEIRWQPTSGVLASSMHQIALSPYFTTTYRLTAISAEGCVATTTLRVEVRRQRNVYAPNAFWPEASALENRFFTLYAEAGVEQVLILQVFDRQGQLCFEHRQFAPNVPVLGWDGSIGSRRASPGVYAWQAMVRYTNGVEEHLAGDVTLVR